MLEITPALTIPDDEINEVFIQGGGPGGQNVNKVATAVQLRFPAAKSHSLPPKIRERLLLTAGSRLTNEGVLVITARRFRNQEANRRDARLRLVTLIRQAMDDAPYRRPSRPTRASQNRRLQDKANRSIIKKQRNKHPDDDT